MKKLFKWLFRLFLLFILLVAGLTLFRDPIAKSLVEREVRKRTGLEVKIGKVSIGLKNPTLAIEDFKLINSREFGSSTFVDVPALICQYDLGALRSKTVHLRLVNLNLGELHVVQNKDGKTNLQALQERQKQNPSSSSSYSESGAKFQGIDTLTLTIKNLKFTSQKNPARNEDAFVGIKNETVKNVKSVKDLQPLLARISLEKGVKFLSENLLNEGTSVLPNATQPAQKEAPKALDGASDRLKRK